MNRAARLQISAQSRSSSMHRAIDLMSCSCKQDAAQCSHAVTHSLQASIQLSCLCGITFLFLFCFVVLFQRTTCPQIYCAHFCIIIAPGASLLRGHPPNRRIQRREIYFAAWSTRETRRTLSQNSVFRSFVHGNSLITGRSKRCFSRLSDRLGRVCAGQLNYDLTAAAMAALRRSCRLAQVLLRIKIELLFALGAAEVIRLPFVLGSSSGGSRFYVHAAHKIFHSYCVLHYHLSFVRLHEYPVPFSGTTQELPVLVVPES